MYRHPDGTYKINATRKVEFEGFLRYFSDLSKEQQDSIGYNEAVPIKRESFTTYETEWIKGDDLVYREHVVSAVVDEEQKTHSETMSRIAQIENRLIEIDRATVRPLRAILAGSGSDEDNVYLGNLETEAVNLRKELSYLSIDE